MELNAIWKSKVVTNYSLKCRDCDEYIFKEKEKLKDGVYIDDFFYSEAICDDCLENYFYCEFTDTWASSRESHVCSDHPLLKNGTIYIGELK